MLIRFIGQLSLSSMCACGRRFQPATSAAQVEEPTSLARSSNLIISSTHTHTSRRADERTRARAEFLFECFESIRRTNAHANRAACCFGHQKRLFSLLVARCVWLAHFVVVVFYREATNWPRKQRAATSGQTAWAAARQTTFSHLLCFADNSSSSSNKLTHFVVVSQTQIVLNSMHKYQPRIHVVLWRGKESANLANAPISALDNETHKTFIFSETIFTAVTAYQNHSVSFTI